MAIQLFASNAGLSIDETRVELLGGPSSCAWGPISSDGSSTASARPSDGYPPRYVSSDKRDVNGDPINPAARVYPRDFIQTGVSAIDGMNTLIRGQKLPIFSGNGLPHNRLAAQIVRQARIRTKGGGGAASEARDGSSAAEEPFAIVFAGMGIKYDVARFFIDSFERSGRALAGGHVPLPGGQPLDRAPHHAALRPHRGRVPGLLRWACTSSSCSPT